MVMVRKTDPHVACSWVRAMPATTRPSELTAAATRRLNTTTCANAAASPTLSTTNARERSIRACAIALPTLARNFPTNSWFAESRVVRSRSSVPVLRSTMIEAADMVAANIRNIVSTPGMSLSNGSSSSPTVRRSTVTAGVVLASSSSALTVRSIWASETPVPSIWAPTSSRTSNSAAMSCAAPCTIWETIWPVSPPEPRRLKRTDAGSPASSFPEKAAGNENGRQDPGAVQRAVGLRFGEHLHGQPVDGGDAVEQLGGNGAACPGRPCLPSR